MEFFRCLGLDMLFRTDGSLIWVHDQYCKFVSGRGVITNVDADSGEQWNHVFVRIVNCSLDGNGALADLLLYIIELK